MSAALRSVTNNFPDSKAPPMKQSQAGVYPVKCCGPQCRKRLSPTRVTGKITRYCSSECQRMDTKYKAFVNACIKCQKKPPKATTLNGLFCSRACRKRATRSAPGLLELPMGHPTFISIAAQFRKQWKHGNKEKGIVSHIYLILISARSMDRYYTYRDAVDAKRPLVGSNEQNLWHGTTRFCLIGDPGNVELCSDHKCRLCSIIENSFDIAFHDEKRAWGRFGRGIYTSATSSKSDSYSINIMPTPLKALTLNKVVVGRPNRLQKSAPTLRGPGLHYDSVIGELGADGQLNYDEYVVYQNKAIRPEYLVMYREP